MKIKNLDHQRKESIIVHKEVSEEDQFNKRQEEKLLLAYYLKKCHDEFKGAKLSDDDKKIKARNEKFLLRAKVKTSEIMKLKEKVNHGAGKEIRSLKAMQKDIKAYIKKMERKSKKIPSSIVQEDNKFKTRLESVVQSGNTNN